MEKAQFQTDRRLLEGCWNPNRAEMPVECALRNVSLSQVLYVVYIR